MVVEACSGATRYGTFVEVGGTRELLLTAMHMYSVASQVRTKKVCMNDERYLRNIYLHSFIFSFLHAYLLSVLIQLRIFIHHKMVAM